jgi:hypothetical protein
MENTGPCYLPAWRTDLLLYGGSLDFGCAVTTRLSLPKETIRSGRQVADTCQRDRSSFEILARRYYSSRRKITCFKVTTKSYNVATRTAEPRRVKTQHSTAKLATLYCWLNSCVVGWGRGGEVVLWPWNMQFGDGYYTKRKIISSQWAALTKHRCNEYTLNTNNSVVFKRLMKQR